MAKRKFDNVEINVEFNEADERHNVKSGESVNTLFGKIKRFFSDLKTVAFTGSYEDLSDFPEIPAPYDDTETKKEIEEIKSALGKMNITYITNTQNVTLSDYRTSGIYCFASSCTFTDQPTGNNNGWLIVIPISNTGTTLKHIWMRWGTATTNSFQTYERLLNASTVGEWRRFATYGDSMTSNRVVYYNGNHILTSDITSTELGYLSGVSSNIQEQITKIVQQMQESDKYITIGALKAQTASTAPVWFKFAEAELDLATMTNNRGWAIGSFKILDSWPIGSAEDGDWYDGRTDSVCGAFTAEFAYRLSDGYKKTAFQWEYLNSHSNLEDFVLAYKVEGEMVTTSLWTRINISYQTYIVKRMVSGDTDALMSTCRWTLIDQPDAASEIPSDLIQVKSTLMPLKSTEVLSLSDSEKGADNG